ncbi:MAG: hypothetical protein FWE95_06310 [Planctomycetaceae bacterium]|nr:hypothetical protein [Planctomycetaceae bacterium]
MRYATIVILALVVFLPSLTAFSAEPTVKLTVLVEEDVYPNPNADNGAGAMWGQCSTTVSRIGNDVFLSKLVVVPDAKPLNNCRWDLLKRNADGWQLLFADEQNRTREPSPIAVYPDSREVFISANPTLVADPEVYSGPAQPQVVRFRVDNDAIEPQTLLPAWFSSEPGFTEHSYRSFAADGFHEELILFQNVGYTHAEWVLRDYNNVWSASGKLVWPWGADYAKPQPIRICYPAVALVNKKAFFFGVSDIIEPNPEWQEFKRELTGRQWDYDFRRLFFTWSNDITVGVFQPWVEISSREGTCGWIMPCDLHVARDGAVHLLWTERAIDTRLRERFFPDTKQSEALCHAVVREGKIEKRSDVMIRHENETKPVASTGRFHVTPDGRIWIVCYVRGTEIDEATGERRNVSENRIVEIKNGEPTGVFQTIPLERPFSQFCTATIRAGNEPSAILDLHGTSPNSNQLRYAAVKFE